MEEEEKTKLIESVLESYNNSRKMQDEQGSTFLSVIGKEYHENYLSRLIAYALKNEPRFLHALLARNKQEQDVPDPDKLGRPTVECEKYMDGSRADIFIEIPDANITVTIENKTDTWEHDDQTRTYHDWVEKEFPGHTNYFFYLYPNYNPSKPSCEEYTSLSYEELAQMIPCADDPIIPDLKKHIELKLGVNSMELKTYDIEVIKHYDELTNILSEAKRHIADYQNAAIEEIKTRLEKEYSYQLHPWEEWNNKENNDKDKTLLIETNPTRGIIGSYRLYKPGWYVKDMYYFYVEILFTHGDNYADIRGIRYQRTLRIDFKDKPKEAAAKISNSHGWDAQGVHVIMEAKPKRSEEPTDFSGDKVWENPEENWRKKFVDAAPAILHRMLDRQSKELQEISDEVEKIHEDFNKIKDVISQTE